MHLIITLCTVGSFIFLVIEYLYAARYAKDGRCRYRLMRLWLYDEDYKRHPEKYLLPDGVRHVKRGWYVFCVGVVSWIVYGSIQMLQQ